MHQKTPYYVTSTSAAVKNAAAAADPTIEVTAGVAGQSSNNILFHEDLRRSLAKMEKLMQIETKLEAARVRRSNSLHMKESTLRVANQRHDEVSREALQRKWVEDEDRARQAFLMKQSSDDQVALRKVSYFCSEIGFVQDQDDMKRFVCFICLLIHCCRCIGAFCRESRSGDGRNREK